MAKIVENTVIIKFSKLAKHTDKDTANIVNEEIQLALEQVAQELVGDSIVVEVVKE